MALLGKLTEMEIDEIIIVQAESQKYKLDIGQNCKWMTAPKGRGSQIQMGLDAAKGDILWILHADSVLPENSLSEIHRIIQDPFTALGCFPLRFNHPNISLRLFCAFSHIPSQFTTFGDQGFFFHNEFKDSLPDLTPYPLLEDVMLYRALRKQGRVVKARHAITTGASRFKNHGVWRAQWLNAVTLWKFHQGESAQKLYDDYYKTVLPPIKSETSLSGL